MYGGGDEEAVGGLEGAEADLDLELGAVLAQSVQVESGAHGSDPLLVGVGVAVFGVVGVEAAGGEEFDGGRLSATGGASRRHVAWWPHNARHVRERRPA
ncbi:hypothetical protein GCM10022207_69130 [Streptomyces lannensis]|uniref:Uncharacterized protein n=1 Tax=Streptomyces lannensis TaxID=766498 RepID=A0ABP7L3S4_9ACTN